MGGVKKFSLNFGLANEMLRMLLLTLNWVINTITLYISNYFIALIDQLLVVFLIHASKVKIGIVINERKKQSKQISVNYLVQKYIKKHFIWTNIAHILEIVMISEHYRNVIPIGLKYSSLY